MPAFDWLLNRLRSTSKKAVTRKERRSRFMRPLRMESLSERIVFAGPAGPPPGGPVDPWNGIVVIPPDNGVGLDPNDPVPVVDVSVDHLQIFENGNPRLSTQFRFTKPAGTGAIQVTYAIDGTATFGNDYTLSGNTLRSLTIPAGTTSATVTVTAVNDTVSDPGELVKATLLPGPGYVVGEETAATIIVDDEPAPPTVSLSVNYTTITENDPFTTSTFTVTRNGTSGALTVGYFLSGTAIYNTDYSGPVLSSNPQGYVTIPNGQSTATFTVEPINDTIYDANETIIAGITSSTSYTILGGPVTVTIIDDESPPGEPPGLPPAQPVSVTASRPTISEAEPGSPVTFTISRGGSTTNALLVNYKFTGSATLEDDYTAPGAATDSITIPAGASSVTFNVSAVDDNIHDDNEIVGVSILPGNDYQVSSTSSASVTIIDNDNPAMARVWVRADKTAIAEATPHIPVTFTFTRDGVLSEPLNVNVRVSGNATRWVDYNGLVASSSPSHVTVAFAAGQSTVTMQANAIDDVIDDDFESLSLYIISGTGYTYSLSNAGVRVYIDDNDGPYYQPPQYVSISVDRDFVHEGSPDVPATFTISRNVPYGDLTVRYYLGGAAILNEDYYTSPGPGAPGDFGYRTITIPSDQWSVSFEAYPFDDSMPENSEEISVVLANGPGYVVSSTGSGYYGYTAVATILDNDEETTPPQQPPPITIDVDIDGSNDDGFNFPKSSDFDFEEELEENPYGIGKIVLSNWGDDPVNNYTPVRVRLPIGLDPADPTLKIRIDLSGDGETGAGETFLWNAPKRAANADRLFPGNLYSLSQLRYNPADGYFTIWMDGKENPSIKTLKGLEDNGRPEGYLRLTVVSIPADGPQTDGANDRVKYVIGTPKSILSEIVDNPALRLGLASRSTYETIYANADMKLYGLQLLTREQLETLGVGEIEIELIFNEETDTIPGLKVKVYRDFNDKPKDFVLSFAGTDDQDDAVEDMNQALGRMAPQYDAAMQIAEDLIVSPGILTNFTITGHSLGGGLASAAACATGVKAVTFNAAGLHRDTLVSPSATITAQRQLRFDNAASTGLVYSYTVDNCLLQAYQDGLGFALPAVLGIRDILDSPYDSTWTDVAWAIMPPGVGFWVPIYKVKSHLSSAYLYGMLVVTDANGTVILDMMGYGL